MSPGPTAAEVAAALRASRYGSWYRTAAFCHNKTARTNTTLAFTDSDSGYIKVHCFAGCTEGTGWRDVRDRLLERAGYRPSSPNPRPVRTPRPARAKLAAKAADPMDELLNASVTIPTYTDHPANLWAAGKEKSKPLLPEGAAFPASVRWLSADSLRRISQSGRSAAHRLHRRFAGAGAIMLPLARPLDWNPNLRPKRSSVIGLQLVYIKHSGRPYRLFDNTPGSDKRTIKRGSAPTLSRAVGTISMPDEAASELNLAEGLADALAVLHYGQNAGASMVAMTTGTAGLLRLTPRDLPPVLRLRIWTDSDDGGDGYRAAQTLARRAANSGIETMIERPPRGHDPASAPLTGDNA